MEGLEQLGSQDWPLGEGGSDLGPRVEGAQHEACVRKGAPKRLSGRLARGWAGGRRVEPGGGREPGVPGAGGQASSRSGQRTAGGAWNRLILALPDHPATSARACHSGLPGEVADGPFSPLSPLVALGVTA